MDAKKLPARPSLENYKNLAKAFLKAYKSGDPTAMRRVQEHFKRELTWEQLRQATQQRLHKLRGGAGNAKFGLADAQFLIARSCGFESWPKFKKHIEAVLRKSSPVSVFESAADAVVAGDIATLSSLLRKNPHLVHARSTRAHQATLLHYVAANGVEDFRQKTPKNAVQVARLLLDAGAEVDAENREGKGGGTALGLVATSYPPAKADVQNALLEVLLDAGACPDGLAGGWSPLTAALANGRGDAAEFLAQHGARLDLEGAAGVGRLDVVQSFFSPDGSLKASATQEQLRSGFTWACEYGRTSVVDFLLGRGTPADARLRHDGQTGLHWAAYNAHVDTVRLFLERNAPVNARDESFDGTPLGWALYAWTDPPPEAKRGNYYEVVALLVASGATVDPAWLDHPDRERPISQRVQADPRMQAALRGEKGRS
jgi:ankyrin repeat protein